MKKIICLSFVLLLVLFVGGCASNKTYGLKFTLSGNEDFYIVTGIEDANTEIVEIPAKYNKLPVKAIGAEAFLGCENLTRVILPEGIIEIGSSAFEGCSSLTDVTLPEGLLTICGSAFEDCSSLTEIVLPRTLEEIHAFAFRSCVSLTGITIPGSVEKLTSGTFFGCSSLSDVRIENGVRRIGDSSDMSKGVFAGCNIWYIVIPESVEYIKAKTFLDNPLKYVVFEKTTGWKMGPDAYDLLTDIKNIPENYLNNYESAAQFLLKLASNSTYTYMSCR